MKKILALGIICLTFLNSKAQNLISNGSFENNAPFYMGAGSGTPEYLTFTTTTTPPITNWIVDADTVDLHHQVHGCSPMGSMGCPPSPGGGDHHIDLNPNGRIHQGGISLIAGNTYVLSFYRSRHCIVTSGTATANVSIGPSGSGSVLSSSFTGSNYVWAQSRFVFVAPSTMVVDLTFEGTGSSSPDGGVLIDSVVLIDSTAGDTTHPQPTLCSDTCYWRVEGNNILAPNRNIFGTLTNDDVRIFTNGQPRGVLTNTGDFGWNTFPSLPTAKFHVNVAGQNLSNGIRFEGLIPAQDTTLLSVDLSGNVHTISLPSGISSSCSTQFFVPRVANIGSPNLQCSQIFDNGTSVGISKISGFGYTSLSGARLGTVTPPTSGNIRLDINGVVRSLASIVTSDAKFKSNVQPIPNAIDIVKSLSGKTYMWNEKAKQSLGADNGLHLGYLAQELQTVIPEVVITDNEGNLAVNYIEIIPILSEAIKEQQKQIENQLAQIEELKKLVAQNGSKTSTGTAIDEANNKSVDGYLAQNTPNPFSNNTEIKYQLPKGTQTAVLGIYDLNGKQVKTYPVNAESNTGSVTVRAQELQAGMYVYSLIIDGRIFDTKKMVLTAE